MVLKRFGKGFGKNKKDKNTKKHKYIHDGLFLFSINHEIGRIDIQFTDDLPKSNDELEADNYLMLIANPGCSLLLDELLRKVHILAEKNIAQYADSDLISDIYFVSDVYLQAFERVSWKMIMDEIYFPVPELAEYRLRHESVVQDRHPENNLISNL